MPPLPLLAPSDIDMRSKVIGVVVAESHEEAVQAARKVKVEYEDILPVIISIEDAIQHKSFFPDEHSIVTGDLEAAKREADHHVTGTCRVGGQGTPLPLLGLG